MTGPGEDTAAAGAAAAGSTAAAGATLAADYRALRHGTGARRLRRDALSVAGPDAAAYLQGQCSQDLDGLAVGGTVDALVLEPDGKLTALVRVVRVADDGFVVDVDAGWGEVVAARLGRYKLRSKLEITALDWPYVALRGASAASAVAGTAGADGAAAVGEEGAPGPYVLPFSWHGVEGVDLLGPGAADAVPAGARWCGEEAWEALRVEAGIPAMGTELDGRTIAAEAGLLERAVSFTKGCYTGQELVARLDARGNRVARRLCGLVVEGGGGAGSDGPLSTGSLVGADLVVPDRDKPVGTVTSAAWCPGVGGAAGLAYLHRSVEVPAAIKLRPAAAGGEHRAAVPVAVRALPLVAR